MATLRETYFNLVKENNKYLNRNVVLDILLDITKFKERLELYKHFDEQLPEKNKFDEIISRVKNGEPYQYVLGYSYFLGTKFNVNNDVLIPRQETEQLVVDTIVAIKNFFKEQKLTICDLCTGSGVIALSLKKQFPNSDVYATDISKEALNVGKLNSKNLELDVNFIEGDMCEPLLSLNKKFDVLVCNPPYIENVNQIDEQVFKYEPHLALLATPSTKYYEEVLSKHHLFMKDKYIMNFEIDEGMESQLMSLVEKYCKGAEFKMVEDLYNKSRFLYIIKK